MKSKLAILQARYLGDKETITKSNLSDSRERERDEEIVSIINKTKRKASIFAADNNSRLLKDSTDWLAG